MPRPAALAGALLACVCVFRAGKVFSQSPEPRKIVEEEEIDVRENLAYSAYVRISSATAKEIQLGRQLFFDPRLSKNKAMSCATCHQPALYWADGLARARGLNQKELPRNTPSLLTAGYYRRMDWDGNADDPGQAALIAIKSPKEMNQDPAELAARLGRIPGYAAQFIDVYGVSGVTVPNIARALAAFTLSLQAPEDSPFDQFLKDRTGLNPAARRGFRVFFGKGQCRNCHSSTTLTDNRFRRIGLKASSPVDVGRYPLDPRTENWDAFRTPTVRNAALTAPYMHDGSIKTLSEVIDFYDRGGDVSTNRDKDIGKHLDLTPQEKEDLLAFLNALTSSVKPAEVPFLPTSGGPD